MTRTSGALLAILLSVTTTQSAHLPRGQKWVTTWAAPVHGPYPSGNPVAQPVLDRVFESPDRGANDQTFRLIVRPGVWGTQARLRFSNVFGTQAVTLDDVFAGLQGAGGSVAAETNRRVTFNGGRNAVTLPPGQSAFSDAVALPFVTPASLALLDGRKLAVSFHIAGSSGPMTWHAKALQTSYMSPPGAGSHGADESDAAFPFTTTSCIPVQVAPVECPLPSCVPRIYGLHLNDSSLQRKSHWEHDPHSNGLLAPSGRFEPPLFDCFHSGEVEVLVPGRALHQDVLDLPVSLT